MRSGRGHPPRIVVCDAGDERNGWMEFLSVALPDRAFEVIPCATAERLPEQSVEREPDVILYRPPSRGTDLAVLRILRRLDPTTPLVIVSEGTSIDTLRQAQEFRPVFHVLMPLDPLELRDAVDAAISQRARRNPAQL